MASRLSNSNLVTDCTGFGGDNDHDYICDGWETPAGNDLVVTYPAGSPPYTYHCGTLAADTCKTSKRDIFVEIDCLTGQCPSNNAITLVKTAFSNAPFLDLNGNGSFESGIDVIAGINLHVQVDTTDPIDLSGHNSVTDTRFPGSNTASPDQRGFDQIKAVHFGTCAERGVSGSCTSSTTNWTNTIWKEKLQVFHYALFVKYQYGYHSSSGTSETYGNDMMISLGSWTSGYGSDQEQAGTLMHELGHNLNLKHGGGDITNCKPNYLSVMSYSRQMSDLVPSRDVDYSSKVMGSQTAGTTSLGETGLDEPKGVASYNPHSEEEITYLGKTAPAILPKSGTGGIDWNLSGGTPSGTWPADINALPGCGSTSSSETLDGYNDWQNIQLNFRSQSNAQDGVSSPPACTPPGCVREVSGMVSDEASSIAGSHPPEFVLDDIDDHGIPHEMNIRAVENGGLPKNDTLAFRDLRLNALDLFISEYQNIPGNTIPGYVDNFVDAKEMIKQDVFYKAIRSLNMIKYKVLPIQSENARNEIIVNMGDNKTRNDIIANIVDEKTRNDIIANIVNNKTKIVEAIDSVINSTRLAAHFTPNEYHKAPFSDGSPRQKESLGFFPNELKCNDSHYVPAIRNLDGAYACITHTSGFENRGWTLTSNLNH